MEKTTGSTEDQIIQFLSDNNEREKGAPAPRENISLSVNNGFAKFIVLTISSLIASFVPICLMCLSTSIQDVYWQNVFSNPSILFTIATLIISVVCEISFIKEKENPAVPYFIPFILIFVVWSMGAYINVSIAEPNTYADVYKIHIILGTLINSLIISFIAIYLANRSKNSRN